MISNRTKVFTINSLRTESDFLRVFVNNLVNLRFYMTTLDLNFGSGDLCNIYIIHNLTIFSDNLHWIYTLICLVWWDRLIAGDCQ